jgi:nitrogen regulatory protein PII
MKAIFIVYNQSHTDKVQFILDRNNVRGFSKWETMQGRGSKDGEPHYGSHTWPAVNSGIMTVVEDEKVAKIMEQLNKIDQDAPEHGLKAFVWNIEQTL